MLVSIRRITVVQLLTRPAPPGRAVARCERHLLLPRFLPSHVLIEHPQRFLAADGERRCARAFWHEADALAGSLELDLVAGLDAVLLGEPLGERQLELAGDLGHGPYFSKDKVLVNAFGRPYRLT